MRVGTSYEANQSFTNRRPSIKQDCNSLDQEHGGIDLRSFVMQQARKTILNLDFSCRTSFYRTPHLPGQNTPSLHSTVT